MKELGFEHIKEIIIEKDGSDTYSASHEFELRLEEKINDGMEIIKGQDHCYWIYDNYRDLYYPTDVSWNKVSEQEFIDKFNKIGFTLYGNSWIDYDFDI